MHSPFDKIDETPDEPFPNVLSFATYVPERKKRNPVGMNQGSLVTSEEELDAFDDQEFSLSEAERKTIIQNAFTQFNIKRPLSQPTSLTVGDLEGADGTVGQSIAGENTVAGWMQGITNVVTHMSNITSAKLGQVAKGVLTGKTVEPNVPTAEEYAIAQKDFVDEDTVAAREKE